MDSAARNIGLDRQTGHDERYDIADEYLEVVYKLWEGSREDDAVRADDIYADPAKVHPISVDAGRIPLSRLIAGAWPGPRGPSSSRCTAAACGRATSRQVRPGLSLLTLGAGIGYTVLAVDRPGYGSSAPWLPRGQTLTEQAGDAARRPRLLRGHP
ncbi:hypothetical protein [Streptomyces sp. TRM68367]|uniref:hypothetical protein n=1 Tax=Streptomyces sp. TRM68367 TaxID=2758415 RepID=UPI0021D1E595|nr:hypothetical protein [Streptomyces sp. TRM68367]